jgi:hypothetical protein
MTKLEIITHLVAAEVARSNYSLRFMSEVDARAAAKLADWILFVAAEEDKDDARTASQGS